LTNFFQGQGEKGNDLPLALTSLSAKEAYLGEQAVIGFTTQKSYVHQPAATM
jgi:hypothetical protein